MIKAASELKPASEPMTKNVRQFEWVASICITAAVIGLHFFFLARAGGLWRDEINLINLAGNNSLHEMAQDSFPILMPLLVHEWSGLGLAGTDLHLRLLGTFIGLGLLLAIWLAAMSARRAPPLLGLLLFATNSTVIMYGDSIRAYGMGSLLIVLMASATWMFLQKPSWLRGVWLGLLAILSVQSLFQNAILVAAICVGACAVCARRKSWRTAFIILLAGLLAAVSLLPYWATIISLPEAAAGLRTGFHLKTVWKNLEAAMGFPWKDYAWVWWGLALAVIVHASVALRKYLKSAEDKLSSGDLPLFAGATLLVALPGFVGFLWYARLPTQTWYFLPLMALAATCFDFSLSLLRGRFRAATFSFVIATALLAVPFAARDLNQRFTNVDLFAGQLMKQAGSQDLVIVVPWQYGITFDHYLKRLIPWTTLPPISDHSRHRYDLVKVQLQKTNCVQPVFDQMTATLRSGHRVWVLTGTSAAGITRSRTLPPSNLPAAPLESSGWADMPYTQVWASQVGHFLSDHSLQFERMDVISKTNAAEVNIAELAELFMASGWKTSQP
ncbi:MAG: hypothetical protein PHY43_06940 [Verrucomicrobiales bacterium]|nr:hypothetical protein [Verrucomicrobiales bacterium]